MLIISEIIKIAYNFTYNYDFCVLSNTNNEIYEIPIVGYVGKEDSSVNFTYMFGVSKNNMGVLGPYYYFTNYKTAIKQGGWSASNKAETKYNKLITDNEFGRYIKGGIIRFALYISNAKYIEQSQDPHNIDVSDIKTYIINNQEHNYNDVEVDANSEISMAKISDYDGKWADTYDSCYLGNIDYSNGVSMINVPLIVLKEYEQQTAISFHHIDKRTLGDKWNEHDIYYIK